MSLCHDLLATLITGTGPHQLVFSDPLKLHSDIISACIQADATNRATKYGTRAAYATGFAALAAGVLAYRAATAPLRTKIKRNKNIARMYAARTCDHIRQIQSYMYIFLDKEHDVDPNRYIAVIDDLHGFVNDRIAMTIDENTVEFYLFLPEKTFVSVEKADKNLLFTQALIESTKREILENPNETCVGSESRRMLQDTVLRTYEALSELDTSIRETFKDLPVLQPLKLPETIRSRSNAGTA